MAQDKSKNKKKNAVVDNNGGQDNTQEKINEKDIEAKEDQKLEEYGQMTLEENRRHRKIHLITIIGEVEGHENLSGNSKATKYDHVLPRLRTTTPWTAFWCCSTPRAGMLTRVWPSRR